VNPRDAEQLLELSRPEHHILAFLRRAPIDLLLQRPPLIPKKHFSNKAVVTQVERVMRVASAWCGGLDIVVGHDAHKLLSCFMWVILGKYRVALTPARTPWVVVVEERSNTLLQGGFEALFGEAVVAAEAPWSRNGRADRVRRTVELAHLGKVSKSLGALTYWGILPLEEAAVRGAFTTLLQPHSKDPPGDGRTFVVGAGGAGPASAV
jgi:hypothetical protein